MAACPKISRGGGGIFEKFPARGGYTKNTPYPLFPLPGHKWASIYRIKDIVIIIC